METEEQPEQLAAVLKQPRRLTPSQLRDAESALIVYVLQDFQEDQPNLHEFREWCEAEAVRHGVTSAKIQRIVQTQQINIQQNVGAAVRVDAQKIAKALGLTRTKAIAKLNSLLEAKKTVIRAGADGKPEKIELPDNDTQLRAVDMTFKLYGSYAAQEINVTHDVSDELAALSMAELTLKAAELTHQIQNDPRFRGTVRAIPDSGGSGAGSSPASPPIVADTGRVTLPAGD